METDKLNRWLALGANVGVLFGLLLVAYEIRQTNQSLDREHDVFVTEVQGRAREGWREFNGRIIESDEVADIWIRGNAGEELSPKEAERYRYLANDIILLYQVQYQQYQVVGRSKASMVSWFESGFGKRPGLRKHLVRIINNDPDSDFATVIKELFPELMQQYQD